MRRAEGEKTVFLSKLEIDSVSYNIQCIFLLRDHKPQFLISQSFCVIFLRFSECFGSGLVIFLSGFLVDF